MSKRYKVYFKMKVRDTEDSNIGGYRLVDSCKNLRAESFKDARKKLRTQVEYDVTDLLVVERKSFKDSRFYQFIKKLWRKNHDES